MASASPKPPLTMSANRTGRPVSTSPASPVTPLRKPVLPRNRPSRPVPSSSSARVPFCPATDIPVHSVASSGRAPRSMVPARARHVTRLSRARPEPSTRFTPVIGTPSSPSRLVAAARPAAVVPAFASWTPISFTSISDARLSLERTTSATRSCTGAESTVATSVAPSGTLPRCGGTDHRDPPGPQQLGQGGAGRQGGVVDGHRDGLVAAEALVDRERADRADLALGAVARGPLRVVALLVVAVVDHHERVHLADPLRHDEVGERLHRRGRRARGLRIGLEHGAEVLGREQGVSPADEHEAVDRPTGGITRGEHPRGERRVGPEHREGRSAGEELLRRRTDVGRVGLVRRDGGRRR